MEQLIHAFGIDAKLIVIQIINFGLLLAALSYLLYKPLLKVLQDREDTIAQGIKDAESAAKAKAKAADEKKEILTAAHKEAGEVALRAKESAEEQANQIVATANDKAGAIVTDAEKKAGDIQAQARADSEAEIAKLAVLAAEKVLREKTS
ncbi:MAG: F0F1 ATP synthase subunit B [Candidatus Paceibacterota bacterium]